MAWRMERARRILFAAMVITSGLIGASGSSADEAPASELGVFCATPAWSPDATKIAFASDLSTLPEDSSNYDIYLVNLQTLDIARLTTDPAFDGDPSWSPDGASLAFVSERTGKREIWRMNAGGSEQVQLTFPAANDDGASLGNMQPAWSPDGTKIAFASERSGRGDILITTPAGEETDYVVAFTSTSEKSPVWSPDGQRLAFVRDGDIWVRNIDGSSLAQLTFWTLQGWLALDPAWSPQGDRIAFTACRRDQPSLNVYVVDAAGGEPAPLFSQRPSGGAKNPAWSPDSARIAFVAGNPNGKGYEVFYCNADGTGITQVTHLNDQ